MVEVHRKRDGKEDDQEGVKMDRKVQRWAGRCGGRQDGWHAVKKLGSWEFGKSGSEVRKSGSQEVRKSGRKI